MHLVNVTLLSTFRMAMLPQSSESKCVAYVNIHVYSYMCFGPTKMYGAGGSGVWIRQIGSGN
jgi:hypothetical protein